MNPKVSVIIPCYNEPEDIFRRSLNSVVDQSLCRVKEDVEIIIILDKPDNQELKDIISEYQRSHTNILLLTPENNLGRGNARNLGISMAQGKYIAIHDADDLDTPQRLEEQYQYMEENPNIGVVFSGTIFTNSKGEELSDSKRIPTPYKASLFQKQLNHQTMFIRTEIMRALGCYKDMNYGEDTDLWMRIHLAGIQMGALETVHSYYLAPTESTHSDYVEKLKKWRISSLKFYMRYFKYVYSDPLFIRFFVTTLLDLGMLHTGKDNYLKYRHWMEEQKRKVIANK